MDFAVYFLKALLIGLAIAAPIGPIGLLCIKKTLELGISGTLAVGLGAACADSIYGIISAIGLSAISSLLLTHKLSLQLIGGILLLYLGTMELKKENTLKPSSISTPKKKFLSITIITFLLTLTNPMTIISFIGVFASIGNVSFTMKEAFVIIAGVFLGSTLWWIILGGIVIKTKNLLSPKCFILMQYGSASILILFGIYSIISPILYQ